MVNQDEVELYKTIMFANKESCLQLAIISSNELAGVHNVINSDTLHKGIEYLIARDKLGIEETDTLDKEQKKTQCEASYKCLEMWAKSFLKSQNRLV